MANNGRGGLTLVVLAAGLGRRFGGQKQVESVGPSGEILLDYSVFDALRAGFSSFVFVVRGDIEVSLRERLAAIAAHCEIRYVTQRTDDLPADRSSDASRARPWGTGHAVWACRDAVRTPFAVANADDVYGASAFRAIAQFLRSLDAPRALPSKSALVGYPLRATLTSYGSVSRGVCEVDPAGRLHAIVERPGVEPRGDAVGYVESGVWHPLRDDVVASMNLWGFEPGLFPLLGQEFARFLAARPTAEDEFGLSTAVGTLLRSGGISVDVLPTDAAWLGVTHRDDLSWVREELRRRVAAGDYPSPLWEGV